jgi:hypothetical protein
LLHSASLHPKPLRQFPNLRILNYSLPQILSRYYNND